MSWKIDCSFRTTDGELISLEGFDFIEYNGISVFIDGYVMPRYESYKELGHLSQSELVVTLFRERGLEFVENIKGSYSIIIKNENSLYVINDYHSFKKFFYYFRDNRLIISSNIDSILEKTSTEPDYENIALFILMEHNVGGHTFFKDIKYSLPATIVQIDAKDVNINFKSYYNAEIWGKLKKEKKSVNEVSEFWGENINRYISYFKPQKIGLTLTGGNDSRMILSALINRSQKIGVFTFGNPLSFDGIVSSKVANHLSLNHNNHYVSDPNKEWFMKYSNRIINEGNSLINIHRSHRLAAIEEEMISNPNLEMLFAGFMGGDYVKGLVYDHYITPRFLWEYEFGKNKSDLRSITIELLNKAKFLIESIDLDKLIQRILELPFINAKTLELRQLNALYYLVGSTHDWQDTNIFASKVKHVVNPFMDIDFLEMLYSSNHSFLTKKSKLLHNTFRFGRSDFHLGITHNLCPQISHIEYAKKGYYSAKEYLNDWAGLLILKRLRRMKKNRDYPMNFPYGQWMIDFIKQELSGSMNSNSKQIFDLDSLLSHVNNVKNDVITERELHQYTNPLNILYNLKKVK